MKEGDKVQCPFNGNEDPTSNGVETLYNESKG
jgi:hypothetical protein